jgi:hypothetical protein
VVLTSKDFGDWWQANEVLLPRELFSINRTATSADTREELTRNYEEVASSYDREEYTALVGNRQLPRVFPPFRVPVPELAPPLLKAFSGAGAVVVTAALVTNELAKAAAPAGCQGEPPCAATLAEFLEGYVTQHRTQCTRHVCMVVDVVTGTRRCATCTSSRCR